MFDNSRPDLDPIARVKALVNDAFQLREDTMMSLAKLPCHEPSCTPVETVTPHARKMPLCAIGVSENYLRAIGASKSADLQRISCETALKNGQPRCFTAFAVSPDLG